MEKKFKITVIEDSSNLFSEESLNFDEMQNLKGGGDNCFIQMCKTKVGDVCGVKDACGKNNVTPTPTPGECYLLPLPPHWPTPTPEPTPLPDYMVEV